MNGWVKIHKRILDWEWWDDHNTSRLFFYILISANWKDKRWKGVVVKRGQLVAGRISLAEATGLSEQNIRTSLSKLKSTSEITTKTTNKFTVITVTNYEKYQDIDDELTSKSTNKLTNNQPTTNQQLTTTEELKKERSKEVKKGGAKKVRRTRAWFVKNLEHIRTEAKNKYPDKNINVALDKFVNRTAAKDYGYKDYWLAFLNWVREDKFGEFASKERTRIKRDDIILY